MYRLHLGCGDKILPGYVNVDIVDERAGKKPDYQCDIRHLTFKNDVADEVLTVHVIEHFYYWEALAVMTEWTRVLKPGGRMVCETPNLVEACMELLKDPKANAGPKGQRTMWVFYGDPKWKDPLMCHKWLYTPWSLADLMSESGLKNVHMEPAQFKLREPRDMRLVGIK
jgi:SAM-dependent methyltransferase